MKADAPNRWGSCGLMLGALGVVYGDIGTSPLYSVRECFHHSHGVPVTPGNVLGVLSLIFWALILIVSFKYLLFVVRANNRGEGGILALLSLALPDVRTTTRWRPVLLALGLFGAAMLYGDGMITPAISVLSAIEGLEVATPALTPYVVPLTVLVLVALFSVQRIGTGRVGIIFGPVMVVWFIALAVLGVRGIAGAPEVLRALNPWYGAHFLVEQGWTGFVVLGSVFLVVTGGEALYADMGHFGLQPIRRNWFGLVLPGLVLNYFGQGALLLQDPGAAENPFFRLAPAWLLYPLVALATMATVIASQALISGAYSLTMHALQLGYLPRMEIKHTSSATRGQIYMPHVNWLLMLASVGLVLGFRSSSNLAAAYGIAVTLTMLITSVLFYFAARKLFGWKAGWTIPLCGLFILVELVFFGANVLKIASGGWFPLVMAAALFTLMTTWRTGRDRLRKGLEAAILPLEDFLRSIEGHHPPLRVKGTAVFMAGNPVGTPLALLHNLKHNKVLHERVVLLTIVTKDVARVDKDERVRVERLGGGLYRVAGHYGFMDEPDVADLLRTCADHDLHLNVTNTTFFLSRETILPSRKPGMARWRQWLFAFLSRNAQPATDFFRLPANRVVELGMRVEI